MKLRNKKTGKIRDFEFVAITKDMDAEFAKYAHHAPVLICRSIDQLNEEWEDYKPKEPLIKDASMQQEIIDLNNRVAKLERQTAESQSHIPESSIGKWF